jgi:pimeloyl-ACP methyl ester carboxylesterase
MLAFDRLNGVCARTNTGWDELAAAGKAAATRPWYGYTNGTGVPGEGARRWGRMLDFDPVPCLRKVRCPVLAIFGSTDTTIPAETSAVTWKETLEASGNKDVTVKVFAHGNHQLFEEKTGAMRDIPRSRGFVEGYFETQRYWLIRHVGALSPRNKAVQ